MEQRSVSEIIEDLQPIIRKYENDPALVLTDAHEEAGSKLGDNYIAMVIRTVVSGKRGDGSPYRRSVMSKVLPKNRNLLEFLDMEALFKNEAHTYNNILPALGDFGPKSLQANKERIMMEDLREKGYSVVDRTNFMDFEHVSYVVKTLATLHGQSLALKHTNPELFGKLVAPLKEIVFPSETENSFGEFMENGLTSVLKCLEEAKPQTDDMRKILSHMERYRNKYFSSVQKLLQTPPQEHYLLCHGDPWTNNLMFKYEDGPDGAPKIVDLKLVDYQIIRYQSPAMDFHYHVYSSARTDVINDHYDELLTIYHRAFLDELQRGGVPQTKWRPLDMKWFRAELKKYGLFGVVSGYCLAHAHLADEAHVRSLNEKTKEELQDVSSWKMPDLPRFLDRVQCLSLHFMRNFD